MTEEEAVKKATTGRVNKYADNVLPMARIRKIMKMDPNITDNITLEANYLVCSAAELFIKYITKEVYDMNRKVLSYQNLSKFIHDDSKLDFLHEIVPKKITVREFKKILAEEMQRSNADDNSGSDVSSSEWSESSSEEEETEESEEDETEKK